MLGRSATANQGECLLYENCLGFKTNECLKILLIRKNAADINRIRHEENFRHIRTQVVVNENALLVCEHEFLERQPYKIWSGEAEWGLSYNRNFII